MNNLSARPEFLVLGTTNKKKLLEMAELLEPLGWPVLPLSQFSNAMAVDETGKTFAENAALKASQQAVAIKQWVVADDSGLEVFSLQGRPGIYSARFAGANATDEDNNEHLLREMVGLSGDQRAARYVCHLALSDPSGEIRIACEDYCYGRMRTERGGAHGFGYDPLFEVVEYHQTFGELGPNVKSCLSHRGRAMWQFAKLLAKMEFRS